MPCWQQDNSICSCPRRPAPATNALAFMRVVQTLRSLLGQMSAWFPEQQEQWHHGRNFHLGSINIVIQPGSRLKVWWTCHQCPTGDPHEWMAQARQREHLHTRCPFCPNRKLRHHNSLSVKAPIVAELWDKDKSNIGLDQTMAGSAAQSVAILSKPGSDSVSSRTVGALFAAKANYQKQPSLTESSHSVMAQFDHNLNRIYIYLAWPLIKSLLGVTRGCTGYAL